MEVKEGMMDQIKIEIHRIKWNLHTIKENGTYTILFAKVAVVVLVLIFAGIGLKASHESSAQIQQGIANEIIRFHCIANSDSDEDQAVKLKVKDGVVELLKTKMTDVTNVEEARECLLSCMDEITVTADEILKENGFSETVNVTLEPTQFPIKVYGDITLPAGTYEALCVRIGKAEGHNWWCIVFPNLCFVDSTYSYVPDDSKEDLKEILTDDEYDAITQGEGIQVKVSFKFFDFLKDVFENWQS